MQCSKRIIALIPSPSPNASTPVFQPAAVACVVDRHVSTNANAKPPNRPSFSYNIYLATHVSMHGSCTSFRFRGRWWWPRRLAVDVHPFSIAPRFLTLRAALLLLVSGPFVASSLRFPGLALVLLSQSLGLEFVPLTIDGCKSGTRVSIARSSNHAMDITYSTACFGRGSSTVK